MHEDLHKALQLGIQTGCPMIKGRNGCQLRGTEYKKMPGVTLVQALSYEAASRLDVYQVPIKFAPVMHGPLGSDQLTRIGARSVMHCGA